MGYDEFMDYPLAPLFEKLAGWRAQQRDEAERLRTLIVEQTCHLMNVSGKELKRRVTPRDFGIDLAPARSQALSEEERQKKIKQARSIEWRV